MNPLVASTHGNFQLCPGIKTNQLASTSHGNPCFGATTDVGDPGGTPEPGIASLADMRERRRDPKLADMRVRVRMRVANGMVWRKGRKDIAGILKGELRAQHLSSPRVRF